VSLPSGHSIGVPLDEVDTIYQLKLWVQNSKGIPVDRKIMMSEEKELMDFVRISDCERMDFDLLLRDVQIGLPQPATENPQRLWNSSTLEREISYPNDDETQTQRNHARKSRPNAEVPVPVPVIEEDIVVLPVSSKSHQGNPNINSKALWVFCYSVPLENGVLTEDKTSLWVPCVQGYRITPSPKNLQPSHQTPIPPLQDDLPPPLESPAHLAAAPKHSPHKKNTSKPNNSPPPFLLKSNLTIHPGVTFATTHDQKNVRNVCDVLARRLI
jgi:hypothetical protein